MYYLSSSVSIRIDLCQYFLGKNQNENIDIFMFIRYQQTKLVDFVCWYQTNTSPLLLISIFGGMQDTFQIEVIPAWKWVLE